MSLVRLSAVDQQVVVEEVKASGVLKERDQVVTLRSVCARACARACVRAHACWNVCARSCSRFVCACVHVRVRVCVKVARAKDSEFPLETRHRTWSTPQVVQDRAKQAEDDTCSVIQASVPGAGGVNVCRQAGVKWELWHGNRSGRGRTICVRGAAARPEVEVVEAGQERIASWRGRRRAGRHWALDTEAVQTRFPVPGGLVAGMWEALEMTQWRATPTPGNVDNDYEPRRRVPSATQAGAARGK